MENKDLNDEDIECILNEYRKLKKEAEINNKEENAERKNGKQLSGEERFSQMLDKVLSRFECPLELFFKIYKWCFQRIYHPFWKKMIRWVSAHRFCPYIVDYCYAVVRYGFFSVITFPVLFLFCLIFLLFTSVGLKDVFVIAASLNCCIFALSLVLTYLYNSAISLYLLDIVTGKSKISEAVELRVIYVHETNWNYWSDVPFNYLAYFFSSYPVACYFYYIPLKKDHLPMSSESKKTPNFYQSNTDFRGKAKKSFRFIMTKKKSKQIDKLFEMVPSAEFEITYLRFSHILKEIRPIEGYEYPEGTKEICDKINKMYP